VTPPKPGTYQRRRPPLRQYPSRPVTPVDLALRGPRFYGETLTAAQWEQLRGPTWERWHHLGAAWPPAAARHDGIIGDCLRFRFARPEGYTNNWDARPRIVELAESGLQEVTEFKRANPEAAKTIAGPLGEYERLLREVLEHPESRLLSGPVPSS
jgi:hypothetical protein